LTHFYATYFKHTTRKFVGVYFFNITATSSASVMLNKTFLMTLNKTYSSAPVLHPNSNHRKKFRLASTSTAGLSRLPSARIWSAWPPCRLSCPWPSCYRCWKR